MFLKTKTSRAFFVMLGLLLAGSMALWYWGWRHGGYPHPTTDCYVTAGRGVEVEDCGTLARAARKKFDQGVQDLKRKGFRGFTKEELEERKPSISHFMWRDVWLGNPAGLEQDQFVQAIPIFKSHVDSAYSRMYRKMVSGLSWHILGALGIWCFLLLAWRTYVWVVTAPR